jgi:hypothetical protein
VKRRRFLGIMGMTSAAALGAACGGPLTAASEEATTQAIVTEPAAAIVEQPAPAAPPPQPPFIVPAGEERRLLMAGTPYETSLYVFGTGRPGRIVLALGGVHGNEPGGFLAADRVVERVRPQNGALLVVPRANKVAVNLG